MEQVIQIQGVENCIPMRMLYMKLKLMLKLAAQTVWSDRSNTPLVRGRASSYAHCALKKPALKLLKITVTPVIID